MQLQRKGRMRPPNALLTTEHLPVGRVDLDLAVHDDDRALGTLQVSEGGLPWRSASGHGEAGVGIPTSGFALWAEA